MYLILSQNFVLYLIRVMLIYNRWSGFGADYPHIIDTSIHQYQNRLKLAMLIAN